MSTSHAVWRAVTQSRTATRLYTTSLQNYTTTITSTALIRRIRRCHQCNDRRQLERSGSSWATSASSLRRQTLHKSGELGKAAITSTKVPLGDPSNTQPKAAIVKAALSSIVHSSQKARLTGISIRGSAMNLASARSSSALLTAESNHQDHQENYYYRAPWTDWTLLLLLGLSAVTAISVVCPFELGQDDDDENKRDDDQKQFLSWWKSPSHFFRQGLAMPLESRAFITRPSDSPRPKSGSGASAGPTVTDREDTSVPTHNNRTTSDDDQKSNQTNYAPTTTPQNVMLHRMRSVRGRSLHDKYLVDWQTVLGEGAYGSVHPARLAATGQKVALKKISRRYTSSSVFQAETDALLRIFDNGGHPNISGLRDMYEDHNYYYLILDLVTGGEMFEHLIQYGAYSEADAARLVYEIASALSFLHGVGVVHADLKPENLLLSTKNRLDGTIKLIDFGCAVVRDDLDSTDASTITSSSKPKSHGKKTGLKDAASTGTTAYWSPERFERGALATPAMDMWSVGVILYIMLTGVHPFDIKGVSNDEEIEKAILANPHPPMDPDLVGHLSESALDLISRLMEPDVRKRLTAYEMLHHPWVRGETALKEKIQDSDKRLSRYQDLRYKLEAGMFAVLVSQGHSDARLSEAKVQAQASDQDDSSVNIMQRAFAVFDAEGKGFVTPDDLGRVAKERTGSDISSRDTIEFLASQNGSNAATPTGLSLSQFKKLFYGLNQKHFPRGHYIFHAGEEGDAMYFLSSGKVEIQTRKGQLVAILRSGDFFGEGSLLNQENKRFTSAKCATPVDVIEIKREDFDRYMGASATAKHDLKVKWRARSLQYAKNLLRLQKNVKLRVLNKGDVVYREGDIGTSMYRVDDADGGELTVTHGKNVVHKYVAGDSFGESSLLFARPRSSTVTCTSDVCRLHEMKGEDFQALVESSPEMASSLKNMCLKRLFKKAVKQYSLDKKRGLTDEDIVAAFHDADIDRSGSLNLDEVRRLMHRMDPKFPMDEIVALLKYVDVDEDGQITLEEFKRLFRQFEDEKVQK